MERADGKKKLKAFLMAAGHGKRLRPLTDTVPKCLLPVNGTPLMQIWLEHLERAGVDEVMINTHWLHETVKAFVDDWASRHLTPNVIIFHEPVLLGSGGTLYANRKWAGKEPFFIIYGDNLTRIDLNKMMDFHERSRMPMTIRIYKRADPRRAGIICLDENDMVIDFEEKPETPKSDLGAGGIYIADHRIFEFFPKPGERTQNEPLDLSCHVLPRLVGNMRGYDSGEFSIDIGTVESYEYARKVFSGIFPDAERSKSTLQ